MLDSEALNSIIESRLREESRQLWQMRGQPPQIDFLQAMQIRSGQQRRFFAVACGFTLLILGAGVCNVISFGRMSAPSAAPPGTSAEKGSQVKIGSTLSKATGNTSNAGAHPARRRKAATFPVNAFTDSAGPRDEPLYIIPIVFQLPPRDGPNAALESATDAPSTTALSPYEERAAREILRLDDEGFATDPV